MTRLTKVLFTAASLVAMAGTALAEDEPKPDEAGGGTEAGAGGEATTGGEGTPAADPAMAADAGVATGLTIGKGKILIAGSTVNINMSASAVGKPFSLAPSVFYGVSDKLQVGIVHDGGTTRWSPFPAVGAGICLAGKENGCAKVYDNVGLDALFGLAAGKMNAAAHVGVLVNSFDPLLLKIRLGALIKYDAAPKVSIVSDPGIAIGVTERDAGNKESLAIPVYLWFNANEKLSVYGASGIFGPLDGFGDAYAIPAGLGATFAVNEKLGVGGDFWFVNIGGKGSSADFRFLGIRAAYAL